MKKIIIIIAVILSVGCNKNVKIEKKIIKKDKIDSVVENMSTEEKIAQMLILNYDKSEIDSETIKYMKTTPPSGFIMMKGSITTYEKTRENIEKLKSSSKIPLIVSIDQEGGSVQKLKNLTDITPIDIPYMYDLGKTKDENLAYNVGKVIAEEVRTIEINVDFAPVIDIYSNPSNQVIGKRSFSEDPKEVSNMAISLSKGMKDNEVIPVFKHFPGHGDTETDSHEGLPIIEKNLEDLNNLEFIPFKKAIETGAEIIMVGHIALPNITGDNTPSTLSKKVIDILKDDLNYKGLIVTDALNMKALTDNYTNEEIYIKAIEAGCDLLLMPNDGINTVKYIKENISEDRINESVKKILKFKYQYLEKANTLDSSYLNSSEHKNIINQIKS